MSNVIYIIHKKLTLKENNGKIYSRKNHNQMREKKDDISYTKQKTIILNTFSF